MCARVCFFRQLRENHTRRMNAAFNSRRKWAAYAAMTFVLISLSIPLRSSGQSCAGQIGISIVLTDSAKTYYSVRVDSNSLRDVHSIVLRLLPPYGRGTGFINVGTAAAWSVIQKSAVELEYKTLFNQPLRGPTPPLPFLPVGTFTIENPTDSVLVRILGPTGKIICEEKKPLPQPITPADPCRIQNCLVDKIVLNTGYDPTTASTIPTGAPDPRWELIPPFPSTSGTLPANSWVISKTFLWGGSWVAPWSGPMTQSQWISPHSYAGWSTNNKGGNAEPYRLRFSFCLCKGDTVNIKMQYHADNSVRVYLDKTDKNATGWLHQTDYYPDQHSPDTYVFKNPPEDIPVYTTYLPAGQHYIEAHLRNTSGTAMGLNLVGTIESATNSPLVFQTHECCNPSGAIVGRKINDTDCDGINPYTNPIDAQGLSGWTINITGPGGSYSAQTDQYGYYSVTGLPPGVYTVSEVLQAGWYATNPSGGGAVVTVNPGETTVVDFLNCLKDGGPCKEGEFIEDEGCVFEFLHHNINPEGVAIDDFHIIPLNTTGPVTFEILDLPSGWSVSSEGSTGIEIYANSSTDVVDYGDYLSGLKFKITPKCTGVKIMWLTTSHAAGLKDSVICSGTDSLHCAGDCYSPPDSLIGWWPFDEASGSTAVDLSPLSNEGNWVGSTTHAIQGVVSRAIDFQTIDADFVSIPIAQTTYIGTHSFSVDAWINLKPSNVDIRSVVYRHDGSRGFIVGVTANGNIQLTLSVNGAHSTVTGTGLPKITFGKWHHIAVTVGRYTYGGASVFFYVDGVSVGYTTTALDPAESLDIDKPLYVGASGPPNLPYRHIDGAVDELEIFSGVLTADQVKGIYNAGPCGKCKEDSSTVCGAKYEDLNRNGVRDNGEPGLAGWTIQLMDMDGNVIQTLETDAEGRFCFRGVSAGTYLVAEIEQAGWVQTQPSSPPMYTIAISAGQLYPSLLLFGNAKEGDCSDVIPDPSTSDPLECLHSFTVHNPWGDTKPINTITIAVDGGIFSDIDLATSCTFDLNPPAYIGQSVVTVHFDPPCGTDIPGEFTILSNTPDGQVNLYWTIVHGSTVCYDTTSMWCCTAPCDTVLSWPIPDEETSNDSRTFLIINRTASPIAWIEWTMNPDLSTAAGAGCSGTLDGGEPFVAGSALSAAQFMFPFMRIPASGTFSPPAQNSVQFNLGIDWFCQYTGDVHFIVHHEDGSICHLVSDMWIVKAPVTLRFTSDPPRRYPPKWMDIIHKIIAGNPSSVDIHYISTSILDPFASYCNIEAITAPPIPKGEQSNWLAQLKMAKHNKRQAMFQLAEPLKPGGKSGELRLQVSIDSGYTQKPVLRVTAYDKSGSIVMVDTISSVTEIKTFNGTTLPDDFNLLDCFPNPSQGFSTVNFALGKPMQLRLELYDNEGKRIQTLFEGRREGGLHSVRFDSGALPSGTYYIRMEADGRSATLPAAVVK